MHGNVNEWCKDVWHENYIGSPVDGSAWLDGKDTQAFRVVRGGWPSAAETVCRSAARQMRRADSESENDDDVEGDPLFDFALHSLRISRRLRDRLRYSSADLSRVAAAGSGCWWPDRTANRRHVRSLAERPPVWAVAALVTTR